MKTEIVTGKKTTIMYGTVQHWKLTWKIVNRNDNGNWALGFKKDQHLIEWDY